MSSKGIYVSLPQEILEEIDKVCGGPSLPKQKKRSGTTGGRAAWVRNLIYHALGKPMPKDVHKERRKKFEQLLRKQNRSIKLHDWESTVQRLAELRKNGLSLRQIAEIMKQEKRATKRGGKWSAQTVRNALLNDCKQTW